MDANILVAEVLRARGRRLLSDARVQLYIASAAWDEATYELPKRLRTIAERRGLPDAIAKELLTEALLLARRNLDVIVHTFYADLELAARARVPQDPNDWPTVALALALDAGIWTEDRDFFGCGLPTWRTQVLQHHVHHHLTETP
ncbi:PIN domain-containing protein [Truepera radiovictrix]|uniref:PIN domain-containing protein n=1 Tax=Truepera radiovictrix TaxID=332249 RepID=UPI0002F184EC|nr:PIN domain-containing protein [Truepera radiovictrix]WMT57124.1 PIN domain-containing protein [Truepera radiovictrix]